MHFYEQNFNSRGLAGDVYGRFSVVCAVEPLFLLAAEHGSASACGTGRKYIINSTDRDSHNGIGACARLRQIYSV